jgi:hypothetical protein
MSPRLLASPAAPSPAASLSALNAQMGWVIQDALFGDLQASAAFDLTAAAAAAAAAEAANPRPLPTQLDDQLPICSPVALLPSARCSTQAGTSWTINPSTLTGRPNAHATQQLQSLSLLLPGSGSSGGGSSGVACLPLSSPALNTPFMAAGAAPALVTADSLPLPPSPPAATTSAKAAAASAVDTTTNHPGSTALPLARPMQQQEQGVVADGVPAGGTAAQGHEHHHHHHQQQQQQQRGPEEAAAPITAAAAGAGAADGAGAPTDVEVGLDGDLLLTTQERLWEEGAGGDGGGGLDGAGEPLYCILWQWR